MKSVVDFRHILDEFVPDAFIDLSDNETAEAGAYPAVQLWDPSGRNGTLSPPIDSHTEENGADSPHFEFAAEAHVDLDAALGSGLGGHVRRATLVRGVDGLAWYQSFHVRGPQWGIYLPITSIVAVAQDVFSDTPLDLHARMRLAAHVLHQHELFHFAVDHMTLFWELAQGRPCWKPGRNLVGPAGYYEREEKLANAHMLRRINAVAAELRVRGRAASLRKFVATQPVGYRDAVNVVDGIAFRTECERLCVDYAESLNGGQVPEEVFGPVLAELLRVDGRLDWRDCPVHVVHDEQRFSLPRFYASLFATVSSVEEPADFRKALEKCDVRIRQAWERTKKKLATTVDAAGLDFKLWARHGRHLEYSVRVDGNFRAHLLFRADARTWTALDIGSHARMGHG